MFGSLLNEVGMKAVTSLFLACGMAPIGTDNPGMWVKLLVEWGKRPFSWRGWRVASGVWLGEARHQRPEKDHTGAEFQ
jgi:hypothetical protein